jgi:hypothetical protein
MQKTGATPVILIDGSRAYQSSKVEVMMGQGYSPMPVPIFAWTMSFST